MTQENPGSALQAWQSLDSSAGRPVPWPRLGRSSEAYSLADAVNVTATALQAYPTCCACHVG